MTCLGAKEISWPKDLSGGPEVTKQTGRLDEAQPVVQVPSYKKGNLVKPSFLHVKSDAQSTWVIGESSKGKMNGDSESPESAAVPDLELSASALNVDPVHGALVVSLSINLEGANPDVAVSATVASKFGFIGKVIYRGTRVENETPMFVDFSVGMLARPTGTRKAVCLNDIRVLPEIIFLLCWVWVARRASILGRERIPRRYQVRRKINGIRRAILDGDELAQDGSEHVLLQWKHSEANPSGLCHEEEESGLLECSPLSKWDPNEQKELDVIQEVNEGEFQGSKVKISKWVYSLMKSFCRIMGFPIVKHEDQCMALFRLLEQDCIDVVNVGTSKEIVNSMQKGLRELKVFISSINYDGVASKGRNIDSSAGTRVLTSVK